VQLGLGLNGLKLLKTGRLSWSPISRTKALRITAATSMSGIKTLARIKLVHVNAFYDRHGRLRQYFRRPGHKSIALPGLPGSAEFMTAYQAALTGETAPLAQLGEGRSAPGTVSALIVDYFNSMAFRNLALETKRSRRNILERFRERYGTFRVANLRPVHIEKMVGEKAATPSAARNFLNTLRAILQFAVDIAGAHLHRVRCTMPAASAP
jgi:hypothetical protein